ncbi:MAG: FtsX-like permease family protein [Bulleidia sp.]
MILHDAFSSLKHDLIHSFFYWLTFVIASMFIFLFLVVSMSDAVGVTFVQAKGDVATNLAVFSSVLCMVEIVFANDFFVKSKSRELAVRLVCGATYVQLAEYLLSQTVFLVLCAIPVGIISGLVCLPLINVLMNQLTGAVFVINISSQAIVWTVVILGFVIFWTLILNLSFAYRNSAAQLLNSQTIKTGSSNPFLTAFLEDISKGVNGKIALISGALLFLVPVALFYYSPNGSLIFAAVSLVGLNNLIKNAAMPYLNHLIEKKITEPETVGYLGFVRHDLKILKTNLLLLIVTSVLLVTVLVSTTSAADSVLVLITYVAMSVLLSMAILFRYASDLSSRKKYFATMSHIGYMEDAERKMITREVFLFYGIVIGLIQFYMINLSLSMIISHQLTFSSMIVLLTGAVIPELICMFINRRFYLDVIFRK